MARGITNRVKATLRRRMRGFIGIQQVNSFPLLRRSIVELRDYQELLKVFGWRQEPILGEPDLFAYENVIDVNDRRLHDAESICTVVRNSNPSVCLEIGTGRGFMTARMAWNAPDARIYTLNIPPEEFAQGGVLTTMKLEESEIGAYYRRQGLQNISQILANTADWSPDIGPIDVAFIDGSHDTDFVVNDTLKVLAEMRAGSFVLWHDFNLNLVDRYVWIRSVCEGVERLLALGHLRGNIYHVQDSWVGIYQVGSEKPASEDR